MTKDINIQILPDGRIKVDCNGVAQADHASVEAFLREVATLAGGPRKRTLKVGVALHAHEHTHGPETHTH